LQGKVFINGILIAETGLHIGGTKSSLNIGEIDLNVIKTAKGIPYIPGSSLKGKLRSLLGKIEGCDSVSNDKNYIKEIFGSSIEGSAPTLLITRDCDLINAAEVLSWETEMDYTEAKWENTIDRKTGTTVSGGLRQLERVPKGAEFKFELIYDVNSDMAFNTPEKWDKDIFDSKKNCLTKETDLDNDKDYMYVSSILRAFALLQDDFIGGHGSRGYGKVKVKDLNIFFKPVDAYHEKSTTIDLQCLNVFGLETKNENNASN
jgi:CRISPR-associated protein Csm3